MLDCGLCDVRMFGVRVTNLTSCHSAPKDILCELLLSPTYWILVGCLTRGNIGNQRSCAFVSVGVFDFECPRPDCTYKTNSLALMEAHSRKHEGTNVGTFMTGIGFRLSSDLIAF